ncbi:amidohydrolase (macronuclear) [Tetrahymena thermophila SB210]|uniref:Amidohydrolase n=1 Tax=Tetrahymena thermophila (strain SB210) TaxID=312017 RepID=I7M8S5_TETTS|nr:amidohydrolase [Tetrahymena thermophila SB210]EAR99577.2 amidohydrolase [Tetrahymena thermophila SB210]|eukprot:XP_001019822.2 amidohydrolase [Tetrahymena thermophila SB210]
MIRIGKLCLQNKISFRIENIIQLQQIQQIENTISPFKLNLPKYKMSSQNSKFDINKLIKFRRNMHLNPETGFKEFQTQQNIKEYLLSIGIQENQIKVCAQTGLVVDIRGQAPSEGEDRLIAFRADIDALSMKEDNPHLEYQSTNGAAHMCGHDGHTTCLLGFASLYMDILHKIPQNKVIRLLFQPSEEGPESGAFVMIQDGCLDQVQEVYGFHNWPTHKVGYLMVKPGPVMSEVTVINLTIIGKGGHGSEPEKANDPVSAAVDFHIKFRKIQEKYKGRQYVCTLPTFNAGERFNVFPDKALLTGTLRSFEDGLSEEFKKDVIQALEELKQERGINYQLNWRIYFPATVNSETEANHVERVAKQYFGEANVGIGIMPARASEDFSFYLKERPGAFFFLGSGRIENDTMLHDCHFDFNEDLINPGSEFWVKLALDRLKVNL